MIAIPNMEKPESCYNHCLEGFIANEEIGCPLKDYEESHQYKDRIHTDCPLIDIVTCGECEYYKESEYIKGDMVCKYHLGHTYYTEADRFCYFGERRADEPND